MNLQAEGTVYQPVSVVVDPRRVRAFRGVFGQATGMPPTFATALEFAVLPEVIGDPRLRLDVGRVLHGNQAYEHRRPLREGETITVSARIESIRIRGGSGFLTVVMDLVGEDGELACEARSTLIERAAG